jgi:hypothetical protein
MALDREASQTGVVLGRSSTGGGAFEEVPFAALSGNDGIAANVLAQTFPRTLVSSSTLTAPTSGALRLDAIWLPAGMLVTSIGYFAGTTAADTPLNQWFALYDKLKVLRGVTADDTTVAWAANATKKLALATAYRTTYSGLYYVGFCVVATAVPTLAGVAGIETGPRDIGFKSGGLADTSLTTPATAPATATTITADAVSPYIELY